MAMGVVIPLGLVVATVVAMEGLAWALHKYVMHGRLGWGWHASHHVPHHDLLERNDWYAVFGAVLAMGLFALGQWVWPAMIWAAVGVSVYAVLYFVAHDGLVHQRWPFRHVPRRGYLKRIYQAHRLHHAVDGRDGCVSFGFLWAPRVDRLKGELRRNREEMSLRMYENEDEALR